MASATASVKNKTILVDCAEGNRKFPQCYVVRTTTAASAAGSQSAPYHVQAKRKLRLDSNGDHGSISTGGTRFRQQEADDATVIVSTAGSSDDKNSVLPVSMVTYTPLSELSQPRDRAFRPSDSRSQEPPVVSMRSIQQRNCEQSQSMMSAKPATGRVLYSQSASQRHYGAAAPGTILVASTAENHASLQMTHDSTAHMIQIDDAFVARQRLQQPLGVMRITPAAATASPPLAAASPPIVAQTSCRNDAGTSSSSPKTPMSSTRQDNSLAILTTKFMKLLDASGLDGVNLNDMADTLRVQKRRLYDITNVLEGIELIEKVDKNCIRWKNCDMSGGQIRNLDSLNDEIRQLQVRERELDRMIASMQAELLRDSKDEHGHKRFSYITHQDIRAIPQFAGQTVIAVKAPTDTRLEVPDPLDTGKIQMWLKCPVGGQIDAFICPELPNASACDPEHQSDIVRSGVCVTPDLTSSLHPDALMQQPSSLVASISADHRHQSSSLQYDVMPAMEQHNDIIPASSISIGHDHAMPAIEMMDASFDDPLGQTPTSSYDAVLNTPRKNGPPAAPGGSSIVADEFTAMQHQLSVIDAASSMPITSICPVSNTSMMTTASELLPSDLGSFMSLGFLGEHDGLGASGTSAHDPETPGEPPDFSFSLADHEGLSDLFDSPTGLDFFNGLADLHPDDSTSGLLPV